MYVPLILGMLKVQAKPHPYRFEGSIIYTTIASKTTSSSSVERK